MISIKKLKPNERLLIEWGVNNYKIAGPGMVCLWFWQQGTAMFRVDPQTETFQFNEVRTAEDIPVNITVRIVYQVDPLRFTPELMPKIPGLQEQGWRSAVQWQTEHIFRQMLAAYAWSELGSKDRQAQLEWELAQTLTEYLEQIALCVTGVHLIRTALPLNLQKTLVRAEQDGVEAGGRARVLKDYFNTFGGHMSDAMPYIMQWESMNVLHKSGKPHLLLSNSRQAAAPALPEIDGRQPDIQLSLPAPPEGE